MGTKKNIYLHFVIVWGYSEKIIADLESIHSEVSLEIWLAVVWVIFIYKHLPQINTSKQSGSRSYLTGISLKRYFQMISKNVCGVSPSLNDDITNSRYLHLMEFLLFLTGTGFIWVRRLLLTSKDNESYLKLKALTGAFSICNYFLTQIWKIYLWNVFFFPWGEIMSLFEVGVDGWLQSISCHVLN